ncbi:MAG TPA: hypothetical protein VMU69_32865 [Bradyrhizobium sp.]|nr:hypothetical protein [Bradyrhizobium sp.]
MLKARIFRLDVLPVNFMEAHPRFLKPRTFQRKIAGEISPVAGGDRPSLNVVQENVSLASVISGKKVLNPVKLSVASPNADQP